MSHKLKPPAKAATKARGDTTTQQPKHIDKAEVCKCPRCGFESPADLFIPGWLDDLEMLAARHSACCSGPDLAAMSLEDKRAHLRWLMKQRG